PHAPGGRAAGARRLPDLRHGARAAHGEPRGGSEPRARRHDPALLAELRAHLASVRDRDVGDGAGPFAARLAGRTRGGVAAARAGDAGDAVGREALLRARVAVDRAPLP